MIEFGLLIMLIALFIWMILWRITTIIELRVLNYTWTEQKEDFHVPTTFKAFRVQYRRAGGAWTFIPVIEMNERPAP